MSNRSFFPNISPLVHAILFHGFLPSQASENPGEWQDEIGTITAFRLSGLALTAAKEGTAKLPADVDEVLRVVNRSHNVSSIVAESSARSVASALGAAEIPHLFIKGPGIAALYPAKGLRPFFDVDVLVPPSLFRKALDALEIVGFTSDVVETRAYVRWRCREAVNLWDRQARASVDLHHHIPPWVLGRRLTFERLAARAQAMDVGGVSVRIPHPIHTLAIVALHLLSDRGHPGRELLIWRDLVTLARIVDPDDAADELAHLGLGWWVRFTLEQVPEGVVPSPLLSRLADVRAPVVDAFRVRRLMPPSLGSRHQIAVVFRAPIAGALGFGFANAFPSRTFLRSRYNSPVALMRWWLDAGRKLARAARTRA